MVSRLGNESSLHSAVKEWIAQTGDLFEVELEGFIIDIVRGNLLIEIQTCNFSAIRKKLNILVNRYPIRLVYPIAMHKWIVHVSMKKNEVINRRKSPKRGIIADIFYELVYIPNLINRMNFEIEILLITKEEIRCKDGLGSWRRRGESIVDSKLLDVIKSVRFTCAEDFLKFLPEDLAEPYTNRMLAKKMGISVGLARRITYSFRKMGLVKISRQVGRTHLYTLLQRQREEKLKLYR